MTYSTFLDKLIDCAEENFSDFQRRLIFTDRKILGVRTPKLRQLAKELYSEMDELLSFPDEYYETVFIKLAVIARLPYKQFVEKLSYSVSLIDCWALCDSFKALCIQSNRQDFLQQLETIFRKGTEFSQRYVLVTLLSEYVHEEFLSVLEEYIFRADTKPYYVHMAVAWLVAEILVKHYEFGLNLLKTQKLPAKTHNKAIQKAIESFRLTQKQKEYLRSLKIKQK